VSEPKWSPAGPYAEEAALMLALAQDAGAMLLAEVARPGGPRGGGDKATVDDEIDAMIHAALRARWPLDTVRSEEIGEELGESGRAFVVDPHDGTRDFLNGWRTSSVSIALVEGGRLRAGVVLSPFVTELTGPEGLEAFWAEGDALRRNGVVVEAAAATGELQEGELVLVSTRVKADSWEINQEIVAPATLRHCASVATRFALVALGEVRASLTIASGLHDWDFAGAQALLQASGGEILDQGGAPIVWQETEARLGGVRGYFASRDGALGRHLASRYCDELKLQ